MNVSCWNEECKFCEHGWCNREMITISDESECEDFESYHDDAEWQKPYWKRLIDRETKQVFRVLFYGKETEIKGIRFFVDVKSDYAYATEESTGLNCGYMCEVEDRIEKIIENLHKLDLPPLESLPIGEYDEKTRKVTPKQETEEKT